MELASEGFIGLVAKESSRFGLIGLGNHDVIILDCVMMKASENCNLSDEGKVVNIRPKAAGKFNPAFEQNILVLVYQNEEGNVIMDRRSRKGFMTIGEEITMKDGSKVIVDAAFAAKYGMTISGDRLVLPNGLGKESVKRTEACLEITGRILGCVGIPVLESLGQLIGKKLNIDVVVDNYTNSEGQTGKKVDAYHKFGYVAKEKTNEPEVSTTPEKKKAADINDDMPF